MIFHSYVSLPEGISHLSDLLPPPIHIHGGPVGSLALNKSRMYWANSSFSNSVSSNRSLRAEKCHDLFWWLLLFVLVSWNQTVDLVDVLWCSLNIFELCKWCTGALSMVCSWIKSRWRFWTSTPHMFCWCLHTEYTDTQLLGVESETSWLNC